MKSKLFFLAIFFLSGISFLNAQNEHYYYYKGNKIPITLNKSSFNVSTDESFQTQLLEMYNFKSIHFKETNRDKRSNIVRYYKIEIEISLNDERYSNLITKLKLISSIRTIMPNYILPNNKHAEMSDFFYVKLKSINDFDILQKVATENEVQIVEQNKFMPLWYTLRCTKSTKHNPLEISNLIYETGFFAAATPDFLTNDLLCTNDPNFNQLWGLNNTSSPNIDINICDAWDITEGEGINVAVLDTGIELTHIDLQDNISTLSYDTESNSSPSQIFGEHATHVSGTIGAVKDNNTQVVGVAPKAKLISVSNSLGANANSRIKRADGINWAWQSGADVINNSWGSSVQFEVIDDAINNALTNGRNGKGTIVIFSSGNDNSNISYPANSNPDILAVGSITSNGSRSSFSNFGSELDVVAPGSGIYSTLPNNTIGSLSGTSMAAPHVSGVAALILSVNPNLTGKEVRDIIEKTSQKIGSFNYSSVSGKSNGTWNNEVGYGLIDAFAAVVEANQLIIEGSDQLCIGSPETYTLTGNIPQGASINWEYPTNRMYVISGQGTPTITFGAFTSGTNQIIKATVTSSGVSSVSEKTIDILSSNMVPVPTTVLAPDNPFNLVCCGQTYTFRHAICSQNCINIEWEFTVMLQDANDIYYFNTTTGDITVQKNTFTPLILSTRARNLPTTGCGNPSDWSNSISRYYGVVSSFSSSQTTLSSNQEYEISSELPLKEYFVTNENNLYIEFLNLYDWLSFRYGNKNLSDDDVQTILKMLSDKNSYKLLSIEVYDFSGAKVFLKEGIKGSEIINLSQFEKGIHFVKFSSSGISFTKKIIIN